MNGPQKVSRKRAERLIFEKRAEWIGVDQVRLLSHPKNEAAAERAAAGYELSGPMTLIDLANLPMVRPQKAFHGKTVTNQVR